jgi:hypothetical protein
MTKRLISITSMFLPIVGFVLSVSALGMLFISIYSTNSLVSEFLFSIVPALIGVLFGVFSKIIAKYTRKLWLSPRIFMSYSHTDEQLAKQLADAFRQEGAEVWIDFEKIQLGENIVQSVEKGLQQADLLVALISGTGNRYLEREVAIAREKGIRVLPVLLKGAAVPNVLREVKYLSFDEADPAMMIKTIVQAAT